MGHHRKAQPGKQGKGGGIGSGVDQGDAVFIGGGVELPGDEFHPPPGGHPAVQLAHGAADQVPGVFVVGLLLLDDFSEGGVVDDALPVHNQLPGEGDTLGQVGKGPGGVGDVLPHLAVAPALRPNQLALAVDDGGGEAVHLGHEIHGLPLEIVAEFPDIRGLPQGEQGVVVGDLGELAHRLIAHRGRGGIGVYNPRLGLQPGQLVEEPVILLVGYRAFVFIIVGIPVLVQPVYQRSHLIHSVSSIGGGISIIIPKNLENSTKNRIIVLKKHLPKQVLSVEQDTGIEPASVAWEATILPMN